MPVEEGCPRFAQPGCDVVMGIEGVMMEHVIMRRAVGRAIILLEVAF